MPTDICFHVLRYSSGVGTRADGTIPWSHLQSADLFVVIKGVDTCIPDGQLKMQIVQGTRTLNSIDIGICIDGASQHLATSSHFGNAPQVSQVYIRVVSRNERLGLQYSQDGVQACRLQLRLRNTNECRQIVEALIRRGVPVQEPRPTTAQALSNRPSSAASQERLLTAQSTTSHHGLERSAMTRASPFQPQTLKTSSLSGSAASPQRLDTDHPTLMTAPPKLPAPDGDPASLLPSGPPSTMQMYRSYTTPAHSSQLNLSTTDEQSTGGLQARPIPTSCLQNLQADHDAATEHQSPPDPNFELPPVTLREPILSEHWSSATIGTSTPAHMSSDTAMPLPDTARPGTSASSSSRPSSAVLMMPPLPKPKIVQHASGSALSLNQVHIPHQAAPSRPQTAFPLKRTQAISDADPIRPKTAVPGSESSAYEIAASDRQGRDDAGPMVRSLDHAVPEPRKRRATPMNELLYGRKPLGERSTNATVPRLSSLDDAPHEIASPPPSSHAGASHFGAAAQGHRTSGAAKAMSLTGINETSLQEYAAQSQRDRQAALDDFMVAHLENPAFMTLCEDVENTWRRIALGL